MVGADGRLSSVRRQLGMKLHQTTPRTICGGMLVDDLHDWPSEQATMGTEDDLHFFIFPRPGGRARLYLFHDIAQKGRFAGPGGSSEFLKAFNFRCIPGSDMFAAAHPAGPCASYPMNHTWTTHPYAPGVVLIGDAAGWSDPIIGQGLSSALRDARTVADVLRSTSDWTTDSFTAYGHERRERMRRLRIAAHVATELRTSFTPDGAARRKAHTALLGTDPVLGGPVMACLIGPEQLPADSFEQSTIDRIMALA
jgi:2-polyprenyl-6-methoxyphenol hydroxylase-like FAD-dependent oxidoreductase